jgi:type IV fimbrial biogenesis protein FimT
METHRKKGFTLIELITATAVAGILLGIGVPSFMSAIKNSHISERYNGLIGSLYLARSEAVKSSSSVTICARATPEAMQCGDDWNNGWIVFSDQNFANLEATASIDGGDRILRVEEENRETIKIIGFGSTNNTAAAAADRAYVRYSNLGASNWNGAGFTVCDDREAKYGRAINIVLTGDVRRGRKVGTSEIPSDVFGREITC